MEETVMMILFEQSTITVLFAVLLVVFFIALVAMSIALFVSRAKHEDDYAEDDIKEIKKLEENARDERIADLESLFEETEEENKGNLEEENTYDSAMDDVFVDTLTVDESMDDVYVNTLNEEDLYETNEKQPQPDDKIWDDNDYDEVGQTDKLIATDAQMAFIESLKARDKTAPEAKIQEITNIDEISIRGNAAHGIDESFSGQFEEDYSDNDFIPQILPEGLTEEAIDASVREAKALRDAVMFGAAQQFDIATGRQRKKGLKKSNVLSTDDFYWYNKMDVAQKPSYKTAEMYYHYFNLPKDCIDDLLMEMYDCALVRTEEIKYIAYGIEPKSVSMKEILVSGNANYDVQQRKKEPTTQDLVKIYEKWCTYVDSLFEKIELHADDYTTEEVRQRLYAFGKNDVEVLIEGK
ncbi:MAG: tetraspanin family protein [Lachnospiraceae bacterium]|nr:tetraspanin family protein [Lachnospiraceae bacterium]